MNDYYRLLAVLEQDLTRTSTAASSSHVTAPAIIPTDHYRHHHHNRGIPTHTSEYELWGINHSHDLNGDDDHRKRRSGDDGSDGMTLLRLRAWLYEPIER